MPSTPRPILNLQNATTDLSPTVDEANGAASRETRDQTLSGIRARLAPWIPSGTPLSDELLADRRTETASE